jgi:hypothetical protein
MFGNPEDIPVYRHPSYPIIHQIPGFRFNSDSIFLYEHNLFPLHSFPSLFRTTMPIERTPHTGLPHNQLQYEANPFYRRDLFASFIDSLLSIPQLTVKSSSMTPLTCQLNTSKCRTHAYVFPCPITTNLSG